MLNSTVKFQDVPEPDIALAEGLFEVLAKQTVDTLGEARGRSEQFAHNLVATEAHKVGLAVTVNAAGNMYIRLTGSKPNPGTIIVPTLMLLVRNQNGSRNPDEAMEMADFAVVTRLSAQGLALVS